MKKKIIPLLLVLLLTVLMSVTSSAEVAVANGTYGDGDALNWSLDGNGVLTISGTGDMPDYTMYTYDGAPWYEYKDQIKTVIVGDAVSAVGNYTFNGYKSITKVDIGSSVKRIGNTAFGYCSALETLLLSEGVETIESQAFISCKSIKKLTIPASATNEKINTSAFQWCELEEITFAEGTKTIDCGTSGGGSTRPFGQTLKKVTFPSTLETIEDYAFYNYSNIDEVIIPKNVKYIGKGAFSGGNYSGVDTLTFEEGGTEQLVIADDAFGSNNLTSLELPERVTTIGPNAFWGIEAESIYIPKNVTSVAASAFNAGSHANSTVKTITVDENNAVYQSIDGILYDKTGETLIMCPRGRSGRLIIPEGVTTIASNAFYDCTQLTSVTLPQGLTTIEKNAFAYTTLSSITLPKTVTDFDLLAFPTEANFRQYTPLTAINVEEGNPEYKSVDGILYTADGKTLLMCPREKRGAVTVLDGVETIADNGFSGCRNITAITLPDSLKTIGSNAFYECNKLTGIVIPQNVESIGSNAFSGSWNYRFKAFSSITLPEGVQVTGKTFGSYVFVDSDDYPIPHVIITNGTHSIELIGDDAREFVLDNSIETVPTVSDLMQNVEGSFIISEKKGDATISYEVNNEQISITDGNIIATTSNCKVVFDDGSDSLVGIVVTKDSTVEKPTDPAKSGFAFLGWYHEEDHINEWNFETDVVNEDTTIYAGWSLQIDNIAVDGTAVKTYDGVGLTLSAESKTGATYQWYTVENGILNGKTAQTLTLDGNVADSARYYCTVVLDGAEATTNTVTVNISKATVEFSVEDLILPDSIVDDTLRGIIAALQSSGINSDQASEYDVSVKYTRTDGGTDNELNRFITDGYLLLKLGVEQKNGDLIEYPAILNYVDEDSDATKSLKANYNVSFSSTGKLTIKPNAVIAWDNDVAQNEGIIVEYTGEAANVSTDYFTATDGKTPAAALSGGEKGYEYYYAISVENAGKGGNTEIQLVQFETMLADFFSGLTVGAEAPIDASDVTTPGLCVATELENQVESVLKDYPNLVGLQSFTSLEEDFGAKIVFDYYVKATYSGDDTYAATESDDYVKLTIVPAVIEVTAKDQNLYCTDPLIEYINDEIAENGAFALSSLDEFSFAATFTDGKLNNDLENAIEGGFLCIKLGNKTPADGEHNYTQEIIIGYSNQVTEDVLAAFITPYYDVTFVPGTLTVSPHTVELTWSNTENRIYGDGKTVTAEIATGIESDYDEVSIIVTNGDETSAGTYTAKATLDGTHAEHYVIKEGQAEKQYTIAPKVVTITFDTDGGNVIPEITQDYGTTVTAPADPIKTGYTFTGWDKDIPETMPAEDITIKALWTPATLTCKVAITGTPAVGKTLTATVSDSNNTGDLSYQWYRHVENSVKIDGATDNMYTVTEDDIRWAIYCVVSSNVQTGERKSNQVGPVPLLTFAEGSVSAKSYSGTYDGLPHSITVIAPDGATVYYSTDGENYELENCPAYQNVGTYTIYYRVAKTNYASVTGSAEVRIGQAIPTIAWPTGTAFVNDNDTTLTGGSARGVDGNILTGSFTLGTIDLSSAGEKNTDITFTPENGNYKSVKGSISVAICKRTVAAAVTGVQSPVTGVYGMAQEALNLPATVTVTTDDGKSFYNVPVAWSGYDATDLDSQTLTGTLDLSAISAEVKQPATAVTASIVVDLQEKNAQNFTYYSKTATYHGTPITHELPDGLDGVASISYSYEGIDGTEYAASVTAPTDAGKYNVTATFTMQAGFAEVAPKTATLIIEPKVVSLIWSGFTADELVYNGTTKTMTVVVDGIASGDVCDATVEVAGDNVNVGTFAYKAVTLSNENYKLPEIAESPAYTITPKSLTVKADNAEAYVGKEQPALTYTVDGFVGSDTFITVPDCSTDANMTKAGVYTITVGGANAGRNYIVLYENGTLTVKNRPASPRPTYDVKIENDISGGDVTISDANPQKGDKVTITADPDKGYEVGKVTVTDSKGNPVDIMDNGDGTYTYVQPSGKVTINVRFVEVLPRNPFVDVAEGDYYYEAVLWAVENKITNGTSATMFSPHTSCTRAQVVTFLWRAAGSPEPTNMDMRFSDVPSDAYYYKAILWAVENSITNGTGDGTFSPNAVCSRGQIVTFLWRSKGAEDATVSNPFVDVATDTYYTEAILWAVEEAITIGTSTTTFSPTEDCTRGQIVTFLWRCLAK